MRLIDADAMRDDWLENGENEHVYDTNAVLESIDSQPTIEATPVVYGHWIEIRDKFGYCIGMKCSNCGRKVRNCGENFCPKCGAKNM